MHRIKGIMKNLFRIETDSMGEMRVPLAAYYGAQTARAVKNFPISGLRFSRQFIHVLGLIKKHAIEFIFLQYSRGSGRDRSFLWPCEKVCVDF